MAFPTSKCTKKNQQLFQDIYRCLVGEGVFFCIFTYVVFGEKMAKSKKSYKKGR